MGDGSSVLWLDVLNTNGNEVWWTNKIRGLYWGTEANDDTLYILDTTLGFTDTGTSCIYGPSLMIAYIKDLIMPMIPDLTDASNWGYTFDCGIRSSLPSFWLLYGDYWFEVTPEDYVVEVNVNNVCALCLYGRSSNDYWILGDAFMRGWYNIHDHTNERFGFIPFPDSPKTTPTAVSEEPNT